MEELNKKLAEWAGFTYDFTRRYSWEAPNKEPLPSGIPDFAHDLNACFKWLVPLLIKLEPKVWMSLSQVSIVSFAAMLKANTDDKLIGWAVENDPALALCKAIERMVDNGS